MISEQAHIRVSAALVFFGLGVEGFTLHWSHPTAFFLSAGLGGLLLGVGVLTFLSTLLGGSQRS